MSAVAQRLRGRLGGRTERYYACAADGFLFRPQYTGGKCPLCGEPAAGGASPLPFLIRADRFWIGVGAFAVASVGMTVLVLVMYFRR